MNKVEGSNRISPGTFVYEEVAKDLQSRGLTLKSIAQINPRKSSDGLTWQADFDITYEGPSFGFGAATKRVRVSLTNFEPSAIPQAIAKAFSETKKLECGCEVFPSGSVIRCFDHAYPRPVGKFSGIGSLTEKQAEEALKRFKEAWPEANVDFKKYVEHKEDLKDNENAELQAENVWLLSELQRMQGKELEARMEIERLARQIERLQKKTT